MSPYRPMQVSEATCNIDFLVRLLVVTVPARSRLRAISRVVGDGAVDSPRDPARYRCTRDVVADRLFRPSIQPSDALSEQYRSASRYCCPDRAAAPGLLEWTDW